VALREAAAQVLAGTPADETKNRADALAWLLGLPVKGTEADERAREEAAREWNREQVQARLVKLADSAETFTGSGTAKSELAHRAERVTLGLERLLVALDWHKQPAVSNALDQLFKDIQSRPDFDPKKFAEELKAFQATLPK
jgi:hypothetical protein